MDKFKIVGASRIAGEVAISGSKNAALPLLAAMLLPNAQTVLHNVPTLKDTDTLIKLISGMGVNIKKEGNTVIADARTVSNYYAPYELVRTMRASILVLGPLLARFGEAEVSLPGGCSIGSRPVDQHLKAFEAIGGEHCGRKWLCQSQSPSRRTFDRL